MVSALRTEARGQSPVDISIVIPCRNGERVLGKQLDALLTQVTDATFEIIVADNGSTDGTAALVQSCADSRVRLADAGGTAGANAARNVGIAAAQGDWILLADADDCVHQGWIQAYHEAFRAGAKAVGGGIDRILMDGTLLARERKLYPSLIRNKVFANSANCGFTREVFDEVGGFDESFVGGAEEVDFFWRATDAGFALDLVPHAVISKVQRTDLRDAFTQYFNFGRGEAHLVEKFHPARLYAVGFLAALQSALWGIAWASRIGRRTTTCSLAWSLGLFTEAVQRLL